MTDRPSGRGGPVFPDGAYKGFTVDEVALVDPFYIRARARHPRRGWSMRLRRAVAIARERELGERAA
jgi:hypothetical protein